MDKAKRGRYFDLDALNGYEFEEFVARLLRMMGYEDVQVTQRTGDKGKDIIAYSNHGKPFKYKVIVECKHTKSVGRPVIQKLQGALLHELGDDPYIKGIIVTSGKFTKEAIEYTEEINKKHGSWMEIELIDGRKLYELCKKHGIKIVSGNIQVVSDITFKHLPKEEVKKRTIGELETIKGIEKTTYQVKTWKSYYPYYCVRYSVHSQVCTKVGCIYEVNVDDELLFVDGVTGKVLDNLPHGFFKFSPENLTKIPEDEKNLIRPFNFSVDELEQKVIDSIINKYTKEVVYRGKNNVEYRKVCSPKKKDILIKESCPIYLPQYTNSIKIQETNYNQSIVANERDIFKISDDLAFCKVCGETIPIGERYVCPVCGKVLGPCHVIFDYLDGTPVCPDHAVPRKLYLQTIYFASKENLEKFNNMWATMSEWERITTDTTLMKVLIVIGFVMLLYLIKILGGLF
ncbi:restriction endonuclease [Methanocaldococcus fervens]|uniref:Restriction endonuclease n=1 Tax=Methanocaldococcus fervens (strain DSM 4213 / JCM 15782 / AG86) TaxID=573064 RepID=C7P9Q7_METFA|nr:restriction endonuclease [Methanocaldococcus fervens]ACV25414.1 restriction endonuclease [Methanocaldococcus fervens AG86]